MLLEIIGEVTPEKVNRQSKQKQHLLVDETVIETIKKKKCKKSRLLSEEGLEIAEKRREAKGKGEKEDIPI